MHEDMLIFTLLKRVSYSLKKLGIPIKFFKVTSAWLHICVILDAKFVTALLP